MKHFASSLSCFNLGVFLITKSYTSVFNTFWTGKKEKLGLWHLFSTKFNNLPFKAGPSSHQRYDGSKRLIMQDWLSHIPISQSRRWGFNSTATIPASILRLGLVRQYTPYLKNPLLSWVVILIGHLIRIV